MTPGARPAGEDASPQLPFWMDLVPNILSVPELSIFTSEPAAEVKKLVTVTSHPWWAGGSYGRKAPERTVLRPGAGSCSPPPGLREP